MKKPAGFAVKTALALLMLVIVGAVTYLSPWTFALLVWVVWAMFHREMAALATSTGRITDRLQLEQWIVWSGLIVAIVIRFISLRWTLAIGLTAIAADIGANVVGLLLGKKLIKREFSAYSPTKSWEGAAGGFIFGTLTFAAIMSGQSVPGGMAGILVIGAVASVAAILGDLRQSHMKREYHIKDTASTLPGHGGMSERLDSVCTTFIVVPLVVIMLICV